MADNNGLSILGDEALTERVLKKRSELLADPDYCDRDDLDLLAKLYGAAAYIEETGLPYSEDDVLSFYRAFQGIVEPIGENPAAVPSDEPSDYREYE